MRIMICGVGGQGVVLLTHMLCKTATAAGRRCISSEFHGMSRMLGSVSTTVKIGDYFSPEADEIDLLVGLDPDETERNLHLVIGESFTFGTVKGARTIDSDPIFRNTFTLGFLCKKLSLPPDKAKALIREFGRKVGQNMESFDMGYAYEA